jgi:hypothetical protein
LVVDCVADPDAQSLVPLHHLYQRAILL